LHISEAIIEWLIWLSPLIGSERGGQSQQELAEKAGLHLTYVGHLELGKYHPTVFVMWKISKALGVSMNELCDF
jgi:transcriptional regulator with XRE-family HTH domain